MTQIPEHERFVGTDVAKNHFDLHGSPRAKLRMEYTPAGLARLLDHFEKLDRR